MNKLMQDFKTFAMRGNVIDMAVGIIIGGAFGKIITSLVADVIMPPIGLLIGGVNFSDLNITLKSANVTAGIEAVTLNYGIFIQTVIDFTIIAFSIFMVIRYMSKLQSLASKREEVQEVAPAPESAPTKEEVLLSEIRDLLKNKN